VREVEAIKLEYRERELFVANAGVWTEDLPEQLTTKECPYCAEQAVDWETGAVECRQCDGTGLVPDYDNIDFRRGFVARVEMATADFLAPPQGPHTTVNVHTGAANVDQPSRCYHSDEFPNSLDWLITHAPTATRYNAFASPQCLNATNPARNAPLTPTTNDTPAMN